MFFLCLETWFKDHSSSTLLFCYINANTGNTGKNHCSFTKIHSVQKGFDISGPMLKIFQKTNKRGKILIRTRGALCGASHISLNGREYPVATGFESNQIAQRGNSGAHCGWLGGFSH